ncbi:MAG: hypothetical protein Q9P01_17940 [Anaerolineae bacterium]|nr:hypothetical protein [Anaerolineae bacterium]MDQ7036637.1 hypothetical protein [Anaerolineae bacterium]
MFRRKPKTRMQRAREDFVKIRQQADDARKDIVQQLNRSAKHLRGDVGHLFDGDDRASRLAKELEHMAEDLEKRTEKRVGDVADTASSNVWFTVLVAFAIGVLVGIMFKIMKR